MFVVEHSALLNRLFGNGEIDLNRAVGVRFGALHSQLQSIEQTAGIAAGHLNQMLCGLWCNRHCAQPIAPFRIGQSPSQQVMEVLRFKWKQPEQAGTADQGLVHFEVRVFRGGPDQGHRSVLHPGQ